MNLPPGFRFHPTDEELITHYLYKKVTHTNFSAIAIGEVDMHRTEPWDLPWKAKMGEEEWYFFCVRDRKYQTGLRTNRATESGYWKSTGKDREIYRGKFPVGMKKTLVFYEGRAPRGKKTNWVMHEYRFDGKFCVLNFSRTTNNEWVICKVYQKTSKGKKIHISEITRLESNGNGLGSSAVPPLAGSSPHIGIAQPTMSTESASVPCFSTPFDDERDEGGVLDSIRNSISGISSNPEESLPRIPLYGSLYSAKPLQGPANMSPSGSAFTVQDQTLVDGFLENHESDLRNGFISEIEQMVSVSQETALTTDMKPEIMSSVISSFGMAGWRLFQNQQNPSASSAAPVDLDGLWDY